MARWARGGLVVALACAAVLTPSAAGKGLDLTLSASDERPAAGRPVTITLRGEADPGIMSGPCRRMRVIVVAPGVGVRRALRSLEGGRASRRIGEWDAFRLASLRSVGRLHWRGTLRPNRPGRWRLVVPNWCAAGYVLPAGVARLHLAVRPAG
jgi:hypothetical protein